MIVIIGGGIAGLAAAYELSQRRLPFVLLEASARAGGLILTEHVDGFTVDGGPDSILTQKPAAIQLCEELALGPRLMNTRPPRTAFVLKHGRLYRLPSPSVLGIPTNVFAAGQYDLLPWWARIRAIAEPLVPRGTGSDESVASFFRRRFGDQTVGLVAEPLLGGIHAGDVEQLSVASLFPRLLEAERKPGKVIRNLRTHRAPGGDGLFRALRGGMSELVTTILERLPADAVRLTTPATGIRRSRTGWQVSSADGSHEARAVIVAAPARAAVTLFEPLDPGAARICRQVPYVSTASVALGYRRGDIRHPLEGSGFVVARRHNALRITACTWVSSKWESRAPQDSALLRVFIGGSHDQEVVDLPDEELTDIAVGDVTSVLGITGPPILKRIYRWKSAGAQHTVGHRSGMADLGERLRSLPGLSVVGSGFDSIGIPDCVANGRRAAASAADYVRMGT